MKTLHEQLAECLKDRNDWVPKTAFCVTYENMSRMIYETVGKRYGMLVVKCDKPKSVSREAHWLCRCDCGTEKYVSGYRMRKGITKSCGCLKREFGTRVRKHGMSGSRIYKIWCDMKARCYDKHRMYYYLYGGRGITVCREWREFENFIRDMGEPPTQKHTIDRIDPNGNYEPSNCRWATMKEQANNTRSNRMITHKGETRTMSQWADEAGMSSDNIKDRLNKLGWTVEKALSTPLNKCKKKTMYPYKGQMLYISQIEKILGLGSTTLSYRMSRMGMSLKEAIRYSHTRKRNERGQFIN